MLAAFVHARLAHCDAVDVGEPHRDHCPRIATTLATSPRVRALAMELLDIPPEAMADGRYGPTFGRLALQRRVFWLEDQLRNEFGIASHPLIVVPEHRRRRRFRQLIGQRRSRR